MRENVFMVTGCAHGIGKTLIFRLIEEGARIIGCDIDQNALRGLVYKLKKYRERLLCISVDVTDEEKIKKTVHKGLEKFGRIDVLVNNAGGSENWARIRKTGKFSAPALFEKVSMEDWNKDIRLNLTSGFLCAKHVIPIMKSQEHGVIINISSLAARTGGNFESVTYASGKAGVLGLTRRMAKELGPFGIRCNCILPGFVMTERNQKVWANVSLIKRNEVIGKIPLRRFCEPSELVDVIMFLASDKAGYITGISLDVSGGFFMNP